MIKTPLSTVIGGAFWTPSATILGGTSKTFNQLIKSLFANNEQGFFYDPNDLSTMFQDDAGTVPVTAVGQPVGLILDKSQLKYTDVPAENFSLRVLGAGIATLNDGIYTITRGDSISDLGKLQISVKPNTLYEIVWEQLSGGTLSLRRGPGIQKLSSTGDSGVLRGIIDTQEYDTIQLQSGVNNTVITFKLYSVREITGNHAYQATSASRPILQNAPRRIDFDTVDDKLITNLPAQLTGCTVIRSVPGVGTQILTGQTIPATYEDNKDHCGLIVINRALTPSETSAIAAEFNKRAGV